jgi:hypothetical protein
LSSGESLSISGRLRGPITVAVAARRQFVPVEKPDAPNPAKSLDGDANGTHAM